MPVLGVQRFIYRNLVQRKTINRALDWFGKTVNKTGIRYATGLTRQKATLFASKNPVEINHAFRFLSHSGKWRGATAPDFAVLEVDKQLMSSAHIPPPPNSLTKIALEAGYPLKDIPIIYEKITAEQYNYSPLPEKAIKLLEACFSVKLNKMEIFDIFNEISELKNRLAEKYSEYGFVAATIAHKLGLNSEQTKVLLSNIKEKTKKQSQSGFKVFACLFGSLSFKDEPSRDIAIARFLSMLDALTDHNRERILNILKMPVIEDNNNNTLRHFNLYIDIVLNYKRLSFAILEGVIEATESGFISPKLDGAEIKMIRKFIDKTHNFSPAVYKIYKAEGESVLDELRTIADKVIEDKLDAQEIRKINKKYRKHGELELLYALIQMVIPLSGASFVSRKEGKGLLKKMIAAGDLREHVPTALRGRTKAMTIGFNSYALKEGEEINSSALETILDGLRSKAKIELSTLIKATEKYLRGDKSEKAKAQLRQKLYSYASRQDILGEKIDRLVDADFYTLRLLEEIFKDKDCLTSIFVKAVDKVDKELLIAKKRPLEKANGLIKAINKMWKAKGTRQEKYERLINMMARYDKTEIQQKLINSSRLNAEAAKALEEIITQDNQLMTSKYRLAEELLKDPLHTIQKEKAKYQLVRGNETMDMELKVVKGIPYGLWGLNAGVCIASDIKLWKDPNFKLIPLIDKETKIVNGFIHVYETKIKGKKYWTLPGIEPSVEFMGTINPEELYDKLIERTLEFAQEKGVKIHGLYIPTSPIIHSNRSDIRKVIKSKNYPTKEIPEVNWSTNPKYPFKKVYVVWEKHPARTLTKADIVW